MKRFLKLGIMLLLVLLPATISAQNRRDTKALFADINNYEVVTVKVGTDGTKYLKVWGFGKKVDDAILHAKRNAIHASIFRGLPGSSTANPTPALCPDPNAMANNEDYFSSFFDIGGGYLNYMNMTTDGAPSGQDRLKVKGGYKVAIYVQVMFDNLRVKLETDGIIKRLDTGFEKAKKPVVMVVPSDVWCIRNGYVQEFDNMGTIVKIPDYQAAMQGSAEIRLLVSQMGDFMSKNGFPIQSLEQELKRLQSEQAEMSLLMGSETGAAIVESPIEQLRRTAKADIILDLDFETKRIGPKKQVSFNLTALDAYTSKIISGNTGVGSNANAPITTLLEEVVLSFKDNFLGGLQRHFDDLFKNGREIVVVLKRFDSAPIDFETEFDYNGQYAELADIIGVWFEENCVSGSFSESERSANSLRYNQVRCPVMGKSLSGKEVPITATGFVRSLTGMLKREPYNVIVKTYQKGLGEVWLILGEK